jgi:hypothetical protein
MRKRALTLALGLLAAAVLAFMLYHGGPSSRWFPGCLFLRLTGFLCPGCGMTRATHAMLHGDLPAAFRFNPLGMILFPIALTGVMFDLIAWVRGKSLPFSFRVGGRWAWAIVAAIIVFWLLRNLPVWPCTLLAPPP